MGFSRQEYWSGLPVLSPGNLPNPGIVPGSPAWQVDPLPLDHQGFVVSQVALVVKNPPPKAWDITDKGLLHLNHLSTMGPPKSPQTSIARGTSSIPGQGNGIPHASSVWQKNNNNNNKIYTENQETHMCILNLLSTTCIDSGCFFPLLFWSFLCSLIYKLRPKKKKKKKLISINREDDWTTLYVDIIFSGKALFEEMVEHTSWMAWSKMFITWTSSIMSHLDLYFYLLKT